MADKKLLEKDADNRYQNAQELIAALHEARNGRVGLPESLTASQKMKT